MDLGTVLVRMLMLMPVRMFMSMFMRMLVMRVLVNMAVSMLPIMIEVERLVGPSEDENIDFGRSDAVPFHATAGELGVDSE
jgi:hypothetical protein